MGQEIAVLGIDPGITGAVALLFSTQDSTAYPNIEIWDFKSATVSAELLSSLNERFKPLGGIQFAILEKVWLWKDERDVKRAEVLIKNSAMWETLFQVNSIPFERFSPVQWRKGLVPKTKAKTKKIYIEKAKALFPGCPDNTFSRHDRAEAALIAYRAWKHIEAGWGVEK